MYGLLSQEARLIVLGGGNTMRSRRCGGTADLVSYLDLVSCTCTSETYITCKTSSMPELHVPVSTYKYALLHLRL